jgi:hypothetical protein
MALYRELSATASAASLSSARLSIGPPSDMSSSRMGPVEEVLGSYRHSFAGLSTAVHTLAAELQARTLNLFQMYNTPYAVRQPQISIPLAILASLH